MIYPLRYGRGRYRLEIPDHCGVDILKARSGQPLDLDSEIERNRLPENFFSGSFRLLIIVNDAFRATPSYELLDRILPELVDHHEVRIIIATGLHRQPTQSEYKSLIGKHYDTIKDQVYWSDSHDRDSFEKLGKWNDGGEVWVHKQFLWAENVLIVGSVEPHYFAGFTGGIKAVVPGLAYCKTIEHNHQKAISMSAQPGKTEGNPVWKELWSTTEFLDLNCIYSYQIVQDSARKIVALTCGNLIDSYNRAVEKSREIYIHRLDRQYDLVIAEHSPPLDRNLYQLQKCFENTQAGVRDGGTLLMLSACEEGIGTEAFYRLAERYPNPRKLLAEGKIEFKLGIHKLYRTALLTNRVNLCLMSSLADADVRRIYIEPVMDANTAIESLLSRNRELSILIVKDAGHTVIRRAGKTGG
ncbi:MAG: nickel-dependent lactate racemase [candidate division Zixibacteria bacterium]|nr:nickel-dependent lactate racemase [candidate division Zixibacteria bacterium]